MRHNYNSVYSAYYSDILNIIKQEDKQRMFDN